MNRVYFERYAHPHPLIPDISASKNTGIVIVIPSFKETTTHIAVESLFQCLLPKCDITILVVVNEPEEASHEISKINLSTIASLQQLTVPAGFQLEIIHAKLPKKKAGVGLARKMGMDEACRIFDQINNQEGIILCFDADSTCQENYLVEIEKAFRENRAECAIVFHEHPLDNTAIIQYELFLRFYSGALRYASFPYAYQTLGSCIAVLANTYMNHGGMNTRKAGEDFYFLHKIIPHCRFLEINATTIYPSSRTSDRVPFGTGAAIQRINQNQGLPYLTYHPDSFEDLRLLFDQIDQLFLESKWEFPPSIQAFHEKNGFPTAFKKIQSQSPNIQAFRKRFLSWWDAFRCLKFIHFAREHFYQEVPLETALNWLNTQLWNLPFNQKSNQERLQLLRTWDRKYPL